MPETRPTGRDSEVAEVYPDACLNGHDWRPRGAMSPGWNGMNRTWRCRNGCDAVTVDEPTP